MTKNPLIIAKTAQTLDGKAATSKGKSKWITGADTRGYARKVRNQFDAIAVGVSTVLADNPKLSAAHPRKRLKKVIFDTRLRTPSRAKIFNKTNPEDCYIFTTKKASKHKCAAFRKRGINVLIGPIKNNRVSWVWARKMFLLLKFKKVLVEGGPALIGSALKEGLVDQVHVYIAPKIAGDSDALDSVTGVNLKDIKRAMKLKNLTIKRFKQDLLVRADVYRNR